MMFSPEKPRMVILSFRVTFSPLSDFQFGLTSDIFSVSVGSFIKLFTPVAKKRYTTNGSMNRIIRTAFFFMA